MLRTLFLSAALALGVSSAANATILPLPVDSGDMGVVRVAEGCGPGYWRGPGGHCHPFATGRLCPRGYHIGPYGHRCWPN